MSESEEWQELGNSRLPDFGQMMAQRLAPKIQQAGGDFDPHAMMVKKNQIEKGEITPDPIPKVEYPADEVKALEDFCTKYGILGFNFGKMPPSVALAMLKQRMGLVDAPLSERVPFGYEKRGTPNLYSSNYPYQKPSDKRVVLNG